MVHSLKEQIEWSRVSVILFDLDDTLVPSEKIYDEVLHEMGVERSAYLRARTLVKERLGSHVCARNRLLYFKALLEAGRRATPEGILDAMDRYEKILTGKIEMSWKALDRPSLFAKLAERFPLFLVTNENTRTQLLKWRSIDPEGRIFRRLISSEEIGVEKPDERMFSAAIKAAGVEAKNSLVVGDSVYGDIVPALQMGMQAVLTTEFRDESDRLPENISAVSKLEDLFP